MSGKATVMRRPALGSISTRLMALVAVALTGLAVLAVLSATDVRTTMLAERRTTIRSVVQEAVSIVAAYEQQERDGKLTRAEAQARALEALNAQRFGTSGYLFGYTTDGTCFLLPPKPERLGKNFLADKDTRGKPYIQELLAAGDKNGGGFVEYWFPKPNQKAASPKQGYAITFKPWGWMLGTGLYVDDVQTAFDARLVSMLLGRVLPVVLVILLLSVLIGRSVTRPIRAATARLRSGDLTTRLDSGQGRTELEQLAEALNQTLDDVAGVVRDVVRVSGELHVSARELDDASRAISTVAEEASEQATLGSRAADELAQHMVTLAAGSVEMEASIREIAGSAAAAARVAGDAVTAATSTNESISRLGDSSAEIGDVVRVINGIAEQTKLLALNATIESARAGEAGKGFAVVATEVKELAQGTTTASEDIVRRVDALVADTSHAVGSIQSITEIIASINDFQVTIAGAIEEQTATTNEIAQVVNAAAERGQAVTALVQEVSRGASRTEAGLDQVRSQVGHLTQTAAELEAAVSVFRRAHT